MKNKIIAAVAGILALCAVAYAQMPVDTQVGTERTARGWSIFAFSPDIPTADTLLTRSATYKPLSAADSLKVVCDAADTVVVRLSVVMPDSTRRDLLLTVNGQDTAYTTVRPLFLESVGIAYGQALTDTLRVFKAVAHTVPDTLVAIDGELTRIDPGHASDYAGQFFITKDMRRATLVGWAAGVYTTTGTVDFELRYYGEWEDARTPGLGTYQVLDMLSLPAAKGRADGNRRNIILNNYDGNRGWVGVFVRGGASGSDGFATFEIQGY